MNSSIPQIKTSIGSCQREWSKLKIEYQEWKTRITLVKEREKILRKYEWNIQDL
jgi:chromosome segregation ATPase